MTPSSQITRSERVFIIAEAGVNHNGDLKTALALVDAAYAAGADAVKFQTFRAKDIVKRDARKAAYQERQDSGRETQFELLERLEMDDDMHRAVMERCREKGLSFFSSAFDVTGLDYLWSLGLKVFKVPSGEIDNLPYLRKVADLSPDWVILSTGASELEEVRNALSVLTSGGLTRQQITVLHCTSEYPAPINEVNLRAMVSMGRALGVQVGYSDHTEGSRIANAATALGAQVIEKHLTLDSSDTRGPDHSASLEAAEFKEFVDSIRAVESALGDGVKRVSPSEEPNRGVIRKSLVAASHIPKGQRFTEENIVPKRPGDGISPMNWDSVVGTKATKAYEADQLIELA